ncbi:NAD(P)-binding protein [Fragilariopsis cylindrus CCMP1102]|uniref:NAD(P)-binding protein n=1 Tax=Fragilariopsis cylindrus CCMP1102 TaxID=635003 RepID=A0A1E7F8G9_9STRA|nr:NAD(P)-binding protein [Fragilariopsis cylindrus CCMP1102]|eukprot:OEU14424.1 NAD(P)-binding protein [Fragilariopsis cylindrus CCMP1102]
MRLFLSSVLLLLPPVIILLPLLLLLFLVNNEKGVTIISSTRTTTRSHLTPPSPRSSIRILNAAADESEISDNDNDEDVDDADLIYGELSNELMPRKFWETTKLNLLGNIIGRRYNNNNPNPNNNNMNDDGVYIPSIACMKQKIVLITGGSSGLGLESAKRLTHYAGATVIVTARTIERCEQAVKEVKQYCYDNESSSSLDNNQLDNENNNVFGIPLDLEDFSSVRTFSNRYRECIMADNNELIRKIDVLMNNAGAGGFISLQKSKVDGYERTFQSCHLGHFLLTSCLYNEKLLNDNGGVAHQSARLVHGNSKDKYDDDWLTCCFNNNNSTAATPTTLDIIEGGQHYNEFQQKKLLPKFATNLKDQKKLWRISEEFTKMKFNIT